MDAKADVDLADKTQNAPILWASFSSSADHIKCVDVLVKAKCDPDQVNSKGSSALMNAVFKGCVPTWHRLSVCSGLVLSTLGVRFVFSSVHFLLTLPSDTLGAAATDGRPVDIDLRVRLISMLRMFLHLLFACRGTRTRWRDCAATAVRPAS